MYRWLKDESYASPVTFLSRPDGTAAANVAEMDGLLQDACRPINRKYATDPEPDPTAFLRRYGHHVLRVPMIASGVPPVGDPGECTLLLKAKIKSSILMQNLPIPGEGPPFPAC